MSNLQVLARRCPVMGKAMTVQSAKNNKNVLSGVFGGTRAHHGGKARIHTSRAHHASVEPEVVRRENDGIVEPSSVSEGQLTDKLNSSHPPHSQNRFSNPP